MQQKLTRYLVRRVSAEVFIWTELLAKYHLDLEEVMAASPAEALSTKRMPDPRHISLAELEAMKKSDLVIWSKIKLNLELDAKNKHSDLLDEVKLAIFTRPSEAPEEVTVDMTNPAGAAATHTTPMSTATAARTKAGA